MARLIWTTDLDTGIDVIDGQHRRIVDYINEIDDAVQRKDRTAISNVIESTIDYTLSHFGFEEALMEDAGYEFSRPHKKVHELFVKRVSDYKIRFEAGEDIGAELHALLARWLFNHIRNDDKSYVASVKSNSQEQRVAEKKTQGWLSKFFRR
jgi:hemerythrin